MGASFAFLNNDEEVSYSWLVLAIGIIKIYTKIRSFAFNYNCYNNRCYEPDLVADINPGAQQDDHLSN
jgi:hypothetical protein